LLRQITDSDLAVRADPEDVTTAAIQEELDRLEPSPTGARAALYRRHLEALLCAARLHEAIDRAERWYARREETLVRFDKRATATVRQLVADARVRPSLTWAST
jgi:hypothetical protein